MPSATAPSTDNYSILKAEVKFMREGTASYRHLGNAPQVDFTPNVEWLEHNSAMEGVASMDFRAARRKSAQLVISLEEWDPENITLAVGGTMTGSPPVISILDVNEVRGAVRVIGTNEVGVRCQWDYPLVSFGPSGTIGLISEEWGAMEITGEVLGPDFGTIRPDITAEVPIGSPPV